MDFSLLQTLHFSFLTLNSLNPFKYFAPCQNMGGEIEGGRGGEKPQPLSKPSSKMFSFFFSLHRWPIDVFSLSWFWEEEEEGGITVSQRRMSLNTHKEREERADNVSSSPSFFSSKSSAAQDRMDPQHVMTPLPLNSTPLSHSSQKKKKRFLLNREEIPLSVFC